MTNLTNNLSTLAHPSLSGLKIRIDPRELLANTLEKIEGAYAHSTIRAYKADFGKFIEFCVERNEDSLPALPSSIANFIIELSNDKRSSAGIRRALCGISTIHKLNRFADPTKDPDVTIEM